MKNSANNKTANKHLLEKEQISINTWWTSTNIYNKQVFKQLCVLLSKLFTSLTKQLVLHVHMPHLLWLLWQHCYHPTLSDPCLRKLHPEIGWRPAQTEWHHRTPHTGLPSVSDYHRHQQISEDYCHTGCNSCCGTTRRTTAATFCVNWKQAYSPNGVGSGTWLITYANRAMLLLCVLLASYPCRLSMGSTTFCWK